MMTDDQKPTEAQNQAEPEQSKTDSGAIDETVTFDDDDQGTGQDGREQETETPESQEQTPDQPDHFINQEAVNERINAITREKFEEKRKREAIEAELKKLKAEAEKRDAAQADIVIPELPDAFDPEYEAKLKFRDDALKKHAINEARKNLERENREKQEKERSEQQRTEVQGFVDKMYKEGEKAGINPDDLRKADDTVAMFIKDPQLARFIISHDKAALLVRQLSSDLAELDRISKMDSINAAAYIASTIAIKAEQYKPSLPSIPEPLDIPGGKPAGEKQNKWLKGVSLE